MLRSAMPDDLEDSLSDEETSVMLGCFAGASPEALAGSTGLPPSRIAAIIAKLARRGLIDAPPQPSPAPPRTPPPVRLPTPRPAPPIEAEQEGYDAGAPSSGEADYGPPPSARSDLVALLDFAMDGLDPAHAAPSCAPESVAAAAGEAAPDAFEPPPEVEDAAAPCEPGGAEPEDAEPEATQEYQRMFQTELRPLPSQERGAMAGTASGATLFALCFDPEAAVIVALLDNPGTTADHARLIALHHRTSRGIEELGNRHALVADGLVHRRLLRNPTLGESTLRRLLGNRRLLDIYKVTIDRDIPERTRSAARVLFRARFASAPAEDKVGVVWGTEGRVLLLMTGLVFDSRTTSILCTRNYASIMLIQNLARFSATPPPLLAHLLKQPLVKRQVHLKNQLLAHPNVPSDAKRKM